MKVPTPISIQACIRIHSQDSDRGFGWIGVGVAAVVAAVVVVAAAVAAVAAVVAAAAGGKDGGGGASGGGGGGQEEARRREEGGGRRRRRRRRRSSSSSSSSSRSRSSSRRSFCHAYLDLDVTGTTEVTSVRCSFSSSYTILTKACLSFLAGYEASLFLLFNLPGN